MQPGDMVYVPQNQMSKIKPFLTDFEREWIPRPRRVLDREESRKDSQRKRAW